MVQAMIGFYTLNNKQALTSFKVIQNYLTLVHSSSLQYT